jgi:hypothetical protein
MARRKLHNPHPDDRSHGETYPGGGERENEQYGVPEEPGGSGADRRPATGRRRREPDGDDGGNDDPQT